jgi:uncharacterized protein (TIGR01619 family)
MIQGSLVLFQRRVTLIIFLFSLGFFVPMISFTQEDNWDAYLADYAGKPGSTLVNLSLYERAPVSSHTFILVTGVKYVNCTPDGFPVDKEFDNLYKISNALSERLNVLTRPIMAGTFTFECERLDYYYLPDTTGIRSAISALYEEKFSAYNFTINIKKDQEWKGYFTFLYPNEVTQEYMANQKVLTALSNAGDKLSGARPLDHLAYFKDAKDMDCFIGVIKSKGFVVNRTSTETKGNWKYYLYFSKQQNIDIHEISSVTLDLRKNAKHCGGHYDGWETQLMK